MAKSTIHYEMYEKNKHYSLSNVGTKKKRKLWNFEKWLKVWFTMRCALYQGHVCIRCMQKICDREEQ